MVSPRLAQYLLYIVLPVEYIHVQFYMFMGGSFDFLAGGGVVELVSTIIFFSLASGEGNFFNGHSCLHDFFFLL